MTYSSSPARTIADLPSQTGRAANEIDFGSAFPSTSGVVTDAYPDKLVVVRPGLSNQEIRKVVANVSGNIFTVNVDWNEQPALNDDCHLSHLVEDLDGSTGGHGSQQFTKVSNTQKWYTFSSGAQTPSSTYLIAFIDGVQMDTADQAQSTTEGPYDLGGSSKWIMGYPGNKTATRGIAGGQFNTRSGGSSTVDGNQFVGLEGGSTPQIHFYGCSITSVQGTKIENEGTSGWFVSVDSNFDNAVWSMDLSGLDVCQIINSLFQGRNNTNETITLDATADIRSMFLLNTNGFTSLDDSVTETIVVRNCSFSGNDRHVLVHNDKTWEFVNPVGWENTSTFISFNVNDANEVRRLFGLEVTVTQPDGTAISGAETYVYEGLLDNNLPTRNQVTTTSSGEADSDVLEELYTFPGSTFTTTTYGDWALKVYSWTRIPFAGSITPSVGQSIVSPVTLIDDGNITETNQTTAITNGSGIVVDRHATGETDPRAMKVLNYDGGTGGLPTVGETMTQGTATGVLVEYLGDATAGTLVLDTWNGTEFTNNQTITGGTSTFSATTHLTGTGSFYEEYTWLVDCNNKAMTAVYDYLQARLAQATLVAPFEDVIIWGEDEYAQPLFLGANGWFSVRNVNNSEGWWFANRGAGTIDTFAADDGTTFTPPSTVTLTITGIPGTGVGGGSTTYDSEVRIFTAGTTTEVAGSENVASGEFQYTFEQAGSVDIVIINLGYVYFRLENFTLPASNATQSVVLRPDRNYVNPA